MKRIIVINTMRLGDLIQTIPLLHSIKKIYQQCELDLLLLKSFSSVTSVIPYVDNFYTLDYELMSNIINEKATSAAHAYNYLFTLTNSLRQRKYDLVINITPTNVAMILSRLISPGNIVGTYLDDYGYKVITNPWIHYFYITTLSRNLNSLNLVDMFIKSAGMPIFPFRPYLNGKRPPESAEGRYFCVHLGASERKRSIEPAILAEAANILCKETGLRVYLLGVSSESDLADEFLKNFKGSCTNLVGKTSVKDLTEIIGQSAFLICHDTGPMHIAWAAGKKVVSLFIATANPFETGPYGVGHYVLQPTLPCYPCDHDVVCKTFECKKAIRPEVIAGAALALLMGNESTLPSTDEIRVMKTIQGPDGMAELIPTRPSNWSLDLFTMLCWRSIIPEVLDGKVNLERILHNLSARTEMFFGKEITSIGPKVRPHIHALEEGLGLIQAGATICGRIIKELKESSRTFENICTFTADLDEIEGMLRRWACLNKQWELPINMLTLGLKTFVAEPDAKVIAEKTLYYYELVWQQFDILHKVLLNL